MGSFPTSPSLRTRVYCEKDSSIINTPDHIGRRLPEDIDFGSRMNTQEGLSPIMHKSSKLRVNDIVRHYMPGTFPVHFSLKNEHIYCVQDSWKIIKEGTGAGLLLLNRQNQSGLVTFYDEFYRRLFLRSQVFEKRFVGLKTRAGILYKLVRFISTLDASKEQDAIELLKKLGRSHAKRNVYPWMYSIFCETLVETIMLCFGAEKHFGIFFAWSSTLSFCLNIMIKQAVLLQGALEFEGMFSTQTNRIGASLTYCASGTVTPEYRRSSSFFTLDRNSTQGTNFFPSRTSLKSENIDTQKPNEVFSEKIFFRTRQRDSAGSHSRSSISGINCT